jgi:ribosomal protein S18 acetylase RimI-like enzyme
MIHTRPVGIDTRPGAVEIVAELQGRTIGTVTVWRESVNIFYCTALRVDPAHRRQGIGRSLMRAAEEHARAHNATIWVTVNESNADALAFFKAIGLRH